MVQPVVATKVVLERDAQLHLAAVMQELYNQVLVVEVEPRPQFTDRVVPNCQHRLLFALLKDAQTGLVDHSDALLPAPEE